MILTLLDRASCQEKATSADCENSSALVMKLPDADRGAKNNIKKKAK
jgi:hypothetical protein